MKEKDRMPGESPCVVRDTGLCVVPGGSPFPGRGMVFFVKASWMKEDLLQISKREDQDAVWAELLFDLHSSLVSGMMSAVSPPLLWE